MANLLQVLATPPDSVYLFSRVDHLEVGREAAYYLQRKIGVKVLDEFRELLTGLLIFFAASN